VEGSRAMVVEIGLIEVTPGAEDAFAAAYAEAKALVTDTPGFLSVRMVRGVESPSRFVLIAEWESVEAHTEGFRGSDRFTQWRTLIGPHFASPPQVEHYTDL
jgi:heme-degrading monooxygenase HmoA